jgi:hypothetical protein
LFLSPGVGHCCFNILSNVLRVRKSKVSYRRFFPELTPDPACYTVFRLLRSPHHEISNVDHSGLN